MDLKTMTYLVVGATFALYLGIAIWARAGSTGEFYAAGRGVNPIANGMATAADWMSAASFISMAGLIAFQGYEGAKFLMGWTGGYVLLALLLAPYLRKFGKFTVPEFIGDRFYSNMARFVGVVCLIVISITYIIGQMKGVGVAFSRFLDMSYEWGLLIGILIVLFYATLGGMKGITYTQIAQYCVLICAYTIPAIFISLNITGSPLPQLGLIGDHTAAGIPLMEKINQTITDLGFKAYDADPRSYLDMTLYTLTLMIGTAGLPHVIIRFFTVPKVSDARWSAGWALVFIALLYTVAPAVGAMARLNVTDTIWPNGVKGEAVQISELPTWFNNWENTGLLKYEDKNGDGKLQYYNDKSDAMNAIAAERGWKGNELTKFDRDIMVLANPEIAQLPNWVIALVAAGGLAAALSTAAGLLLAISSSISHDLFKGIITPDMSEKNELLTARLAMVGAIGIAGYYGLYPPGFAAQVVALAFGLAASSIFPVLMMGIFSKRVNNHGAILGMASGIGVTLAYIFAYKGLFFIKGTEMFANTPENWFMGISPEAFGAIGALVNFVVAYVVSMATSSPPKEIQDLVESIRVPRGAGAATGH
ncbi:MAG: cation acetate symporter [Alphaproteobacteria bacterium]|nr:cation acetate symporter [Alphaproteobacteria bacterium]